MLFSNLSLPDHILKRLGDLKYDQPTPIQQLSIPEILNGQSLIIRAETGSGKTASYAIPILALFHDSTPEIGVLILVPTRELVLQVQTEIKSLAFYIENLKISAFYGGHAFDTERKSLVHPPRILVATPGRLADHLRRDTLSLENAKFLVIDEADKLLEMGFEEELKFILKYLPFQRQSVMLSATFPESLENLATTVFRKKPKRIEADQKSVPLQIENYIIKSQERDKEKVLVQILERNNLSSTIIFCNTREMCRNVLELLEDKFQDTGMLQGEMEQADRDKMMARFRNGSVRIMVATDIASRGLDIAKLGMVINYELPDQSGTFLHRFGRTGRAGEAGLVYSIVTDREWNKMNQWEDIPKSKLIDVTKIKAPEKIAEKVLAKTTIHIHAGKKEKISKADIVGALIAEAGLQSSDIGLIELFDHFSYVAIPVSSAYRTIQKLSDGKIKGRKIKVSVVK